jgi:hypothetical protein
MKVSTFLFMKSIFCSKRRKKIHHFTIQEVFYFASDLHWEYFFFLTKKQMKFWIQESENNSLRLTFQRETWIKPEFLFNKEESLQESEWENFYSFFYWIFTAERKVAFFWPFSGELIHCKMMKKTIWRSFSCLRSIIENRIDTNAFNKFQVGKVEE